MPNLVSVLMPVLNEERSVIGAVNSALEQRGVDIEVLVINGRSTDRTESLVRELMQRDARVRLVDNPESIIPAALNAGLKNARGNFVARIDGHATVSQDYIQRAVSHLDSDPKLAAVGGKRIGVAQTGTGRAIALALGSKFGVGNSVNHYATEYQLTDHASFGVFRTEVVRSLGGWDPSLLVNEDVDLDHRILSDGWSIGYDPEMSIHWHVRETVRDLYRQYRRYGRGKARMVSKNGIRAMKARHMAAPAAMVGGICVLVAGIRRPKLLFLAGPYTGALSLSSVLAWGRRPRGSAISVPAIPAAFLAMHVGWGMGFIEGLAFKREPVMASGSSATSS